MDAAILECTKDSHKPAMLKGGPDLNGQLSHHVFGEQIEIFWITVTMVEDLRV